VQASPMSREHRSITLITALRRPIPPRGTFGPITFGNILYGGMVRWTGGQEPGLLTMRCHSG
jgi:hypothetical protein